MITVCQYHIKNGLFMLPVPHVYKNKMDVKCKFCDAVAEYTLEI